MPLDQPPSLLESAPDIPDWAQIFASPKDLLDPEKYKEAVEKACPVIREALSGLILPEEDRTLMQEIACGGSLAAAIGAPPLVPPDQIALEWLVQKILFEYLKKRFNLHEVNHFSETRHRECIVISKTGSIVIVGNRQRDGKRHIYRVQIPSRQATRGRQIIMGAPIPGVHDTGSEVADGLYFAGHRPKEPPEAPTKFLERIRNIQVGWGLMSLTSDHQFCTFVDRILVLPDNHENDHRHKHRKSGIIANIGRKLRVGLRKLGLW